MNPFNPFALLGAAAILGYMVLRQQSMHSKELKKREPRSRDPEELYGGEPIGV